MYKLYDLYKTTDKGSIPFSSYILNHSANMKESYANMEYLKNLVKMLNVVKDVYRLPPYVIAGGCIRDIILGLTPKDWDVFIPMDRRESNGLYNDLYDSLYDDDAVVLYTSVLEVCNERNHDPIVKKHYEEAFGKGFCLYEGESLSEQAPFDRSGWTQLIGMTGFETSEELLSTFDYSLTKVACLPDLTIMVGDDFQETLDTGNISCYNSTEKTFRRASGLNVRAGNRFHVQKVKTLNE